MQQNHNNPKEMITVSKHHETEQAKPRVKRRHRAKAYLLTKDENHLLFLGFVVVLISMLIINTVYVLNKTSSDTDIKQIVTAERYPSTIQTTLQPIHTPTYDAKVTNVSSSNAVDKAFPLSAGDKLVYFDFTLKNNSSSSHDFIPIHQLYIRDHIGGYYTIQPSSQLTNPIAATTLLPEQEVTGQVAFAVPKDTALPLLYIDLAWNDVAPSVISINQ